MSVEDIKQVAQLRKAIAPLVTMLRDEATNEMAKQFGNRLDTIESILLELAKKESVINVAAPIVNVAPPEVNVPDVNITVETPEELTKSIQKMSEPVSIEEIDTPTAYEPHDQAKGQVYSYSGFMRSDGAYYIQRVSKGEQRYARGNDNYAEAWESRSKLQYGYLGTK